MKSFLLLLLLLIVHSCSVDKINKYECFPNDTILDKLKGYQFAIAHAAYGEGFKIIGMKRVSEEIHWHRLSNTGWGTLKDSIDTMLSINYEAKQIVSSEIAKKFINQLDALGIFTLKTEVELTTECPTELCQCQEDFGEIFYNNLIEIYVKSDSITYFRHYFDPVRKANKCPNKKDWKNIVAIDSLFRKEWINQSVKIKL